jgi:chitodextrinase
VSENTGAVSAAAAKRTVLAAVSVVAVLALSILGSAGGAASAKDDKAPSAPENLRVVAATPSLVSVAWDASTDDVGVEGYYVLRDREPRAVTIDEDLDKPSYVAADLTCGQSALLTVVAFDRAGNRSEKATLTVATAACLDTAAPSAPDGFAQLATSENAVVLGWAPARDNVGVVSYGVYRDLQRVASPAEPSVALAGLACGSNVLYSVDAVDAAGNRSLRSNVYVRTAACPQAASQTSAPATAPTTTSAPSSPAPVPASSSDWAFCAHEHYRCEFSGVKEIRYGADGAFTSPRTFTDGVQCSNAVFGDPLKGTQKRCELRSPGQTPPPAPQPTDWSYCAAEHQRCAFSGTRDVRYGANGTFTAARSFADGVQCSNAVFGDPVKGTVKRCESRSTSSAPPAPVPPAPSPTDTTPPSVPRSLGVAGATGASISLAWGAATDNVAVTGYRTYVNNAYGATTSLTSATVSGLRCGNAYTLEVDAVDAQGNASPRATVIGSTGACTDTQAPSTPSGVVATSRTATSIALSWTASTDNVGVTGYGLHRDGTEVGTTSTASGIVTGLSCNTSYTLSVDAYDAAGNRSSRSALMVSTTACSDTSAPSVPTGLAASNVTQTSLSLAWNASTDNVRVAGYYVYRDGNRVASPSASPAPQSGLVCGTAYAFAVEAYDAAGNRSPRASTTASTSACSTTLQWTLCANEGQHCAFSGAREVRYGANGTFTAPRTFADGVSCTNSVFGDPVPGTVKYCEVRGTSSGSPPPLSPTPTGAKPLTNSITSGGTYTGTISGTVAIRTLEPVVIERCTITGGSIDAYHSIPGPGIDLTIRRCTINGVDTWDSPRWLTARDWKRLVVENNTINNTRGIELWPNSVSSPVTSIVRNLHRNPKGTTNGGSLGAVGNFIQLRVIGQSTPIEIAWNEIVSEYGRSNAEDVISIYKTAHTRIHDNLINGQTKPSGFSGSSQNSITIDPHGEPHLLFDNRIERNFVIDAYAIGMFGGNNNYFGDNYVLSDGYMGDTGISMQYGYEGFWVAPGFSGNLARGNVVGYIGAQGRVDGRLNEAGDWVNNTHFAGSPTRQTEVAHIAMWRQRAAAAGITIGA